MLFVYRVLPGSQSKSSWVTKIRNRDLRYRAALPQRSRRQMPAWPDRMVLTSAYQKKRRISAAPVQAHRSSAPGSVAGHQPMWIAVEGRVENRTAQRLRSIPFNAAIRSGRRCIRPLTARIRSRRYPAFVDVHEQLAAAQVNDSVLSLWQCSEYILSLANFEDLLEVGSPFAIQFARSQSDHGAGSHVYENRAVVVWRGDSMSGLHRHLASKLAREWQMADGDSNRERRRRSTSLAPSRDGRKTRARALVGERWRPGRGVCKTPSAKRAEPLLTFSTTSVASSLAEDEGARLVVWTWSWLRVVLRRGI